MKSQPILILGHWHTGSSCLARILKACGMNIGNKETLWNEDSIANCEHAPFNDIGMRLYHNMESPDTLIPKARDIIRRYKEQAEKHGWGFWGIKSTHILQDKCWKHFYPLFQEELPNAKYVIPTRHPLDLSRSRKNTPDQTEEYVIKSWLSTLDATLHLILHHDTQLVVFPEDFMGSQIKVVVENIGLTWNEDAKKLFDVKQIANISTEEERKEFDKKITEILEKQ